MPYSRNIYVASLPTDYTDDQLHALFATCGSITSCKMKRDRLSGSCKGYGFVLFASEDDAIRAVSSLNGHMINKTRIQVRFARPEASAKRAATPVQPPQPQPQPLPALLSVSTKFVSPGGQQQPVYVIPFIQPPAAHAGDVYAAVRAQNNGFYAAGCSNSFVQRSDNFEIQTNHNNNIHNNNNIHPLPLWLPSGRQAFVVLQQ